METLQSVGIISSIGDVLQEDAQIHIMK
jgi:hypothetical protein